MRDFKGMKRQRGRNRGGNNQGKPQQNANRAFESNGPDNVKIRGNAQHVFERYQQLARDAASAGVYTGVPVERAEGSRKPV